MEPRTFRQPSCALIAGGIIAIVGAAIFGIAGYHLATGTPLMQGGSKFQSGEHVANSSELWFGVAGGLPFLVFGLVLILSTLNCAVTIDEQGLSATNLLGRKRFQASWLEITTLDRVNPNPGSGYTVKANGKSLAIQSSTGGMKELVDEIKRRAPNLKPT